MPIWLIQEFLGKKELFPQGKIKLLILHHLPNSQTTQTILADKTMVYFIISECLNYQYLGDPSRARGYEGNSVTCDKPLPTKWYRLSDSAGSEMPTSCVTKNRCGTHAPGWLSGAHPTVAQGIQSVKVCFHWLDNCCMWSTNIRVRNCDGYYVYELKTPPACHLRYCGNSG